MGFGSYTDDDFNPALSHAQSNQSSSDDGDLFSTALSFLKDRRSNRNDDDDDDLDDDDMIRSHKSLYGGGDSSEHDSGSVGKGAAIEALKMFTSGGGSSSGSSEGGGGMDKNALIGMAMAQAGKLWEEKQSSGSGDVVCLFLSQVRQRGWC